MIQPEIRMAEDLLDNIENQRLYQVLIGGGDKLTLEILLLKKKGYSVWEIATYLGITEKAAKGLFPLRSYSLIRKTELWKQINHLLCATS